MKCNCSVYLTSLLRYPCFLVILTLFSILLEKYLKITHKTCWHIYTRPLIGVTPSECLISCKMCSDKISLKLGMLPIVTSQTTTSVGSSNTNSGISNTEYLASASNIRVNSNNFRYLKINSQFSSQLSLYIPLHKNKSRMTKLTQI